MATRQVSRIGRTKLLQSGIEGLLTSLTYDIILNSEKPLTRQMIADSDDRLKVNCVPQFTKNLIEKGLIEECDIPQICESTGNLAHYLRATGSRIPFHHENEEFND